MWLAGVAQEGVLVARDRRCVIERAVVGEQHVVRVRELARAAERADLAAEQADPALPQVVDPPGLLEERQSELAGAVGDDHLESLLATREVVVFCGSGGVGKTSVVERLAERLDATTVLEEWGQNPFLKGFYDGTGGAAFQTELFFLLSRYRQQQELVQRNLGAPVRSP